MIRRLLPFVLCLVVATECFAQATPAAQTSPKEARHRAQLGVQALQQWYVPKMGLYRTTGWWNSANAITTVTDYMRVTGKTKYKGVLKNTFKQAQKTVPVEQRLDAKKELTGFPGFLNKYYDDEGWWALAWIDAWDLTHDGRYLTMSRSIFDDMAAAWDQTCGGGIWWSRDRKYKNAIANELFLSVAAHLANRVPEADRGNYANWATKEWQWFKGSGMINDDHLINDGLKIDEVKGICSNNQQTVWSYNQGVVLGGLAELSKQTGNPGALDAAKSIADAALTHLADKDGVLHDPCEPNCGGDGIQFKGIFVRNLSALNAVAPDSQYAKAFTVNAEAIWQKNRTPQNTFGTVWSGPVTTPDAGTQSSALDVLVATTPAR
ncbi:MAG: glycoside hydrolase family 76 protein [Edaphobacter sp.]|uniref:glycoside hydrolase family 76 protein n=1 Tax=Edaphobacter sp. TaxID=1934404 RepID=UPI0023A538FD|nr:glycoside hydrolase family 76 protein [Edaphobacter sp.]MDE1176870.1 glycoside hydrolase family 76 protein [Edaphobacter sp.]